MLAPSRPRGSKDEMESSKTVTVKLATKEVVGFAPALCRATIQQASSRDSSAIVSEKKPTNNGVHEGKLKRHPRAKKCLLTKLP